LSKSIGSGASQTLSRGIKISKIWLPHLQIWQVTALLLSEAPRHLSR
jgi:hypothetical protein